MTNIVTLDFETYFDSDYTLSKMTTEAYIRDPRFKAHGLGVRFANGEKKWFGDPDEFLHNMREDPSAFAVLCHHAHFDGLILSHHYGIKPAFWLDTLSMARLLIGNHLSVSLDNLSKHFGLAAKNVPYHLFKGKQWGEIPPHEQRMVADGCLHDVELTWQLFQLMQPSFPNDEYLLIDQTIRMFTEPVLIGNTDKLAAVWENEEKEKRAALANGVTGADLRSNERFADLLRAQGVEPEIKETDKGEGYAFAKTDQFMRDLQEDASPRVRALAEARLGERSNILQSRSARLGWMSTRGPLCVYLSYCAAHTTRFGGGDKCNFQNFPRNSALGEALEAPPGHLIVTRDLSQIEARLLNAVAGQHDKVQDFREGKDPYVGVASAFCGRPITKETDPEMRQGGKIVELQSGFGSGGPKIASTLRKLGIPCTDEEGLAWRDAYRSTHPAVVNLWREADRVIQDLHNNRHMIWRNVMEVRNHRIYGPNGTMLNYEALEWHRPDEGDAHWRLRTRDGWVKLYGAKLVENVIQWLARICVTDVWLCCARAGIRIVSSEHDSLRACVPEQHAQAAYDFMGAEMARAPEWMPDLPLDSEGYVSRTFAKEKRP